MKNFNFLVSYGSLSTKATLGRTGFLRINKSLIENLDICRDDKWVLALDNDEKDLKYIYVLKTSFDKDIKGRKMIIMNNYWALDCKKILPVIKFKLPIKCELEKYQEKSFEGFRIILN